MEYFHFASRPMTLEPALFSVWSDDCAAIVKAATAFGLLLAGPSGHDLPIFDETFVGFNGRECCGHDPALPIASNGLFARLRCPGTCAGETFAVARTHDSVPGFKSRFYTDAWGTDLKPYDTAVIACLLMLAYRFGPGTMTLESSGDDSAWRNGQQLALLARDILPPIPPTVRRKRSGFAADSADAAAAFIASAFRPPANRTPTATNRCLMQDATRIALFTELEKRGVTVRRHRLLLASDALGRDVDTFTRLSEPEARELLYTFADC